MKGSCLKNVLYLLLWAVLAIFIVYTALLMWDLIPKYNRDNAAIFAAGISALSAVVTIFAVLTNNNRTIDSQKNLQNNQLTQQKNELLYKISYEKLEILIELRKEDIKTFQSEISNFGFHSHKAINLTGMAHHKAYQLFKVLETPKNENMKLSRDQLITQYNNDLAKIDSDYIANHNKLTKCINNIKIHKLTPRDIMDNIREFENKNIELWGVISNQKNMGELIHNETSLNTYPDMQNILLSYTQILEDAKLHLKQERIDIENLLESNESIIKNTLS